MGERDPDRWVRMLPLLHDIATRIVELDARVSAEPEVRLRALRLLSRSLADVSPGLNLTDLDAHIQSIERQSSDRTSQMGR